MIQSKKEISVTFDGPDAKMLSDALEVLRVGLKHRLVLKLSSMLPGGYAGMSEDEILRMERWVNMVFEHL